MNSSLSAAILTTRNSIGIGEKILGKSTRKGESGKRKPAREVMILTELEQIKVLADPLRIRILEEFFEERTTKQVADRIGEKATKLYHHVEALKNVGLVELTRTRQNRGTLEKYYLAAACQFTADSRAFCAGEDSNDEERDTLRSVISTILDTTSAEMLHLAESKDAARKIQTEGLLSFVEVCGDKEQIVELRRRLRAVLDWILKIDGYEKKRRGEQYRLTLAFYPLDRKPRKIGESPDKPSKEETNL